MRGRLINWGCVGPALAVLALLVGAIVLGITLARHDALSVPLAHNPGSVLRP